MKKLLIFLPACLLLFVGIFCAPLEVQAMTEDLQWFIDEVEADPEYYPDIPASHFDKSYWKGSSGWNYITYRLFTDELTDGKRNTFDYKNGTIWDPAAQVSSWLSDNGKYLIVFKTIVAWDSYQSTLDEDGANAISVRTDHDEALSRIKSEIADFTKKAPKGEFFSKCTALMDWKFLGYDVAHNTAEMGGAPRFYSAYTGIAAAYEVAKLGSMSQGGSIGTNKL